MMMRRTITKNLYQRVIRPILFKLEADRVHEAATRLGERLENSPGLVRLFCGERLSFPKTVLGLDFPNPVGLAAGFDYNGHLAQVLRAVGFGFNTVGTVTAKSSPGNTGPQLARLPKSRALLVNKGFKSDGAEAIAKRLDQKKLSRSVIGLSVGSSNVPTVNTISKAIDDYLETFSLFQSRSYVKYFELNISCPNTDLAESFVNQDNFSALAKAVMDLRVSPPIFVKMPNEIALEEAEQLVRVGLQCGIRGFIVSNLVKDRTNREFDETEIANLMNRSGNFSGRPTAANAQTLSAHLRRIFGRDIAIISCGGIFSPADAIERLDSGADLVQLITGMIYEGPQIINETVARLIAVKM